MFGRRIALHHAHMWYHKQQYWSMLDGMMHSENCVVNNLILASCLTVVLADCNCCPSMACIAW